MLRHKLLIKVSTDLSEYSGDSMCLMIVWDDLKIYTIGQLCVTINSGVSDKHLCCFSILLIGEESSRSSCVGIHNRLTVICCCCPIQ